MAPLMSTLFFFHPQNAMKMGITTEASHLHGDTTTSSEIEMLGCEDSQGGVMTKRRTGRAAFNRLVHTVEVILGVGVEGGINHVHDPEEHGNWNCTCSKENRH